MINYRKQNGCYNCKEVFILKEYEGSDEYFCTLNAPMRPSCLYVLMDEIPVFYKPKPDNKREHHDHCKEEWKWFDKLQEKWDKWAKNREVTAYGICDSHIINK